MRFGPVRLGHRACQDLTCIRRLITEFHGRVQVGCRLVHCSGQSTRKKNGITLSAMVRPYSKQLESRNSGRLLDSCPDVCKRSAGGCAGSGSRGESLLQMEFKEKAGRMPVSGNDVTAKVRLPRPRVDVWRWPPVGDVPGSRFCCQNQFKNTTGVSTPSRLLSGRQVTETENGTPLPGSLRKKWIFLNLSDSSGLPHMLHLVSILKAGIASPDSCRF